ncbi:A-kinase anchor protein 9-like [Mesocricetus auratus]|uniref:A-kinase anchor protein 9-like n=1 Tax=Mesocricetus auratus TaxID=10036 RepID=A0ABM2W267_MESAU|nr:A-kinase anchor protein 9-like [Mesocricetus auratus]
MNVEEKVNSFVYHAISRVTLQEYRYQVEEFQDAIQNLLYKVTDEHNKFVTLQMELSKIHEQQTDGVKVEFAEENVAEEESGILSVRSQAGLESIDIRHESELSFLPESEDSEEHEKELQGLESPVNALEQPLKATEAHYGTEIPTVQGSVETIHGPSAHPSVDSVVFEDSDLQKTLYCGNCLCEHTVSITEIHEQQTDGVKVEFAEENVAEEESGILSVRSQAGLESIDIRHESELSFLPESEDSEEHEKELQGLESPVDTLEQLLKATEAHYGAEIPTVQGSVETIHGPSAHPSVDSVVFEDSDLQKTLYCGNCLCEHTVSITEIHEQQTDGVKVEFAEENVAEEESGILSVRSQAGLESIDIRHESELSFLPESEDSEEHEKELQGLESPVDTLEQPLKATEAHYGAEIPTVQGSVETIHGPSAHPSVDSVVFEDSGNCLCEHTISITEPEEMLESFTQNQENTESLWCLDDLNDHQQEQPRSRDQPAVHLNKAESIVDGYSDENIILEREIQEKACTIDHLDQELLCMSGRLQELEEEQQQIQEERALLSRQEEAMGAGAGPVEQRPADVVVDAAPGAGVCTVACTVVGLETHNSKFG